MKALIISGLKLLLRNKGFWFFLIVTPIASLLLLNNHNNNSTYYHTDDDTVTELSGTSDKVAYYNGDGKFVIKIYDASCSSASETLAKYLTEGGLFKICRAKDSDMTEEDYALRTEYDGVNDRMNASIYISSSFESVLSEGRAEDGLIVSILSDDPRSDILKGEINIICGVLNTYGDSAPESICAGKTVTIESSGDTLLTNEQIDYKVSIGYAMAFMTLGYVFCGIFVAHTIMEERRDKVAIRIDISGLSPIFYFMAKFITGIFGTTALTGMLGIGMLFMGGDYGIPKWSLLILLFLMGLIFTSMSIMIGVFSKDVMTANIIAFTIWSFSSMLAGTFFPLTNVTTMVKFLSSLMPQKWFMDVADEIFLKSGRTVIMLLCIMTAYLFTIISFGSVGIRYSKNEE